MLAAAGSLMQKLTGNPMASPEVLGVTLGAAFGVVVLLLLVPGDVSAWQWLAGSVGAGVTLLLIMLLANRGGYSSSRLLLVGIALSTVFSTLLTYILASGDPRTGALLASATLVIGPLSFVGLMAPHLARFAGFWRALPQLLVATLMGAMLIADWVGRVIIFPYQIPAGLLATFLGEPYFIWLLRKQSQG